MEQSYENVITQIIHARHGARAAYQKLAGVQAKLTIAHAWPERINLCVKQGSPAYDLLPIAKNLGLEAWNNPVPVLSFSGRLEAGRFDTHNNLDPKKTGITLAWSVEQGKWNPGGGLP
jgi:hypothetical protein